MKYCECKSGLVMADLEKGEGKCPICGLPKLLNKRLKKMSEMYKGEIKMKKELIKPPKYRFYCPTCKKDYPNIIFCLYGHKLKLKELKGEELKFPKVHGRS